MRNFALSSHFNFFELTRTDHREYQDENRRRALEFKEALRHLAVNQLEFIRAFNNGPVFCTSGFRYDALNRAVKGSERSQHRMGQAGDLWIPGIDTLEKLENYGKDLIDCGLTFGQLLIEPGPVLHVSSPRGVGDGEFAYYNPTTKQKRIFRKGTT